MSTSTIVVLKLNSLKAMCIKFGIRVGEQARSYYLWETDLSSYRRDFFGVVFGWPVRNIFGVFLWQQAAVRLLRWKAEMIILSFVVFHRCSETDSRWDVFLSSMSVEDALVEKCCSACVTADKIGELQHWTVWCGTQLKIWHYTNIWHLWTSVSGPISKSS